MMGVQDWAGGQGRPGGTSGACDAPAPSLPAVRDVIEAIPDPYALGEPVFDAAGDIVDFMILELNAIACASVGLSREAVLGTRARDLFPSEFGDRLIRLVGEVVTTGRPLAVNDYLYPSTVNGGALHRYDVRATALDGRLVFTWRDVTFRFEERRRFEQMITNSADVVLLMTDGVVDWASAGVVELLGRPVDEIIGTPADQLVHPADRPRLQEARAADIDLRPTRSRLRFLRKGGGSVWCEARLARIDGGSNGSRVVSLRDITEAMDVEDAARESEARYRLVAENASDVVYTTDRMYRFNWVSPSVEAILGWAPGELIGTPTSALLVPEDRGPVAALRTKVFVEGQVVGPHNLRYRTRQGGYRWMSMRAHPVSGDTDGRHGVVVTLRDVEGEVLERRATDTLAAGNGLLAVVEDESALLEAMCETAVRVGGYAFAWYGRIVRSAGQEGGTRAVVPVASSREGRGYLDDLVVRVDEGPWAEGVTGRAARSGVVAVEPDIEHAPNYAPWRDSARSFGFRSSACLPVVVDGRMDGVLTVYASEPRGFDIHAQEVLQELSRTMGYGIERLRDRAELHQTFVSSIDLVAAVVESRDPYTAGHQALVAELARAIGTELGFDEHRLDGLALAARIHDVGKIGVPIDILCRPGSLHPEELAVVRRHAVIGWEIAGNFTWPWPVADIIHQHHEQFDGSGYPQGLRGEEILLEARIVSVADCYQAIASRRPYREALGEEFAYRTVVEGAGTQFDPDVVDAFVRVIDAGFTFSATRPEQG